MRHAPDAVMIFAAGLGTRMGELTQDRPKPLIEVAGKALIDHTLDLVEEAKLPDRVANVHYKPDQLTMHLEARDVVVSDERDVLLDTGGGLKKALGLLPDRPLFTINSDAIFKGPNPLSFMKRSWDLERMGALLLVVPAPQAHGRNGSGDFSMDASGILSRGGNLIYTGVQIINPKAIEGVEEDVFSLNVVWDRLHEENRLFGLLYPGHWSDVGHPEGISVAEALLQVDDV